MSSDLSDPSVRERLRAEHGRTELVERDGTHVRWFCDECHPHAALADDGAAWPCFTVSALDLIENLIAALREIADGPENATLMGWRYRDIARRALSSPEQRGRVMDLTDPSERERLRAERRKDCCGDEAWRGRPCPYHEGFEDGEDSALDLVENLIAERDEARAENERHRRAALVASLRTDPDAYTWWSEQVRDPTIGADDLLPWRLLNHFSERLRALSSPEHEEGPEFGPGTDLYPTRPVVAPTDTPIEAPPALRPSSPEHEETR